MSDMPTPEETTDKDRRDAAAAIRRAIDALEGGADFGTALDAEFAALKERQRLERKRQHDREEHRTRWELARARLLAKGQAVTDDHLAGELGISDDTIGRWRRAGDID